MLQPEPQRPRRRIFFVPRVSLRDHIAMLVLFTLVGSLVVSLLSRLAPGRESAIVGLFVYGTFAIYYSVMLYNGVRYDTGKVTWRWQGMNAREMLDCVNGGGIDVGPLNFDALGLADDLFGVIVVFLLTLLGYLILAIVLIGLAWVGVNLFGYLLFLAWIPLYAAVRFGIRLSLSNVRRAKGRLGVSCAQAAVHALFPAAAIALSVFVIEKLASH